MVQPLLQGNLVRLTAVNPETDAEATARWSQDDLYTRLSDSFIAYPTSLKKTREIMDKRDGSHEELEFSIRTLDGDRLIGIIGLGGISWQHGDCFVGIGVGEREFWGKGYGTDAMQVILRYAFEELNLHRVSLNVFEYNLRAIRSYEKVGFVHEGRARKMLLRGGRAYDVLFMGILQDEWLERRGRAE